MGKIKAVVIVPLTQGQFAIVDKKDYKLVSKYKWCCAKKYNNKMYAVHSIRTKNIMVQIKMHRLILGITDPTILVDHINGNGLDNRRSNLRIVTKSQNGANRDLNIGRKYKGVQVTKSNTYRAMIMYKKKCIYLGTYKTREKAIIAYNTVAIKLFGKFAKPNDIVEDGE